MRRPAQPTPASKAYAHEIESARATAFRELAEHAVGVGNAPLSKQMVAVLAMTKAAGDGGPYAYCRIGAEEEIRTPDPLLGKWGPALQAATDATTPIRSMQAANN